MFDDLRYKKELKEEFLKKDLKQNKFYKDNFNLTGFDVTWIIRFVIIILAFIIIGGLIWLWANVLKGKQINKNEEELNESFYTQKNETSNILPLNDKIDTDGDGIIDKEEESLGIDKYNTDTDGDGLFDGEEVNFYKTNPLNKDTDGDGYEDGKEVKNGYNPNGSGKL